MTTHSQTSVKQAMEHAIGANYVSDSVADYAIDGTSPQVIVTPQSIDDLGKVMAAAYEEGFAVAPWGGGTHVELGNSIKSLDVIADVSGINKVVQHNSADLTVQVEAGTTLSNLKQTLAQEGQMLALDPPLPDRATIGGTLAAGISGPLRWHYGSARDLVIGMKVIQADGRMVKSGGQVVKNVSGYDMGRTYIGSLGTLGIIAEVSFKLTPLPRQERTILASFDSSEKCLKAGLSLFNSDVMPLALTAFDANANSRAKIVDMQGSCILAVRLGGRSRTLERLIKETLSICKRDSTSGIEQVEAAQAEPIWRKLADFGWDEPSRSEMAGRISLLPTQLIDAARALEGEGTAIVLQPGYGMINAHWYDANSTNQVLEKARDSVHPLGGSLIVERCPADVKSGIDVWDGAGDALAVMRRLKEQYDPKGIINPGRFVGGI